MNTGILLINLGTPSGSDISSVRRYLREFLTDKRIIDLPFFIRYALVYLFILPFRPRKSAHAYQSIWTEKGSPLLVYSELLADKLQKQLGHSFKVALAMRYGQPSIKEGVLALKDCQQIIILPLFPQYSSAATGSAIEEALQQLKTLFTIPSLLVIDHFFQSPAFIESQAARIRPFIENHDFILFSYHGIPVRQLQKSGCTIPCKNTCPISQPSNCYRAQCFQTTELLAQKLGLKSNCYATSFQSRLGKTAWIEPYTEPLIDELAENGIKNLAVCCPSFTVDCLETLEEIGLRAKEQWANLGGGEFTLIPALNDDEQWVNGLAKEIKQRGVGCRVNRPE